MEIVVLGPWLPGAVQDVNGLPLSLAQREPKVFEPTVPYANNCMEVIDNPVSLTRFSPAILSVPVPPMVNVSVVSPGVPH